MFAPSECGMKAFVVTGAGDVFILAAIFIIYHFAGTLNYQELIHSAPEWLSRMGLTPGLLGLTAILFLGGPIGKSAQFPLHEWLPEAMAGPTSVSALIHAATMVKAGVYLVARMSPVFYIGTYLLHLPEAQLYFIAIACVGAFTCFLAASQAIVSIELKKILAYSTVSQIGYMMLGLGLSGLSENAYIPGLTAGVFHLVSHALFKASLFLCAGSVIHSIHSIYTTDMGGLRKYMPKTFLLMTIATLSLAGIPPFSGFWSKDAVFIAALAAGTPLAYALLAVGAISAAMTMAYSIRYIWVTFIASESKHIHDLDHHGHPPHESPIIMWAPIAVLVALMLGVSLLGLIGQIIPGLNPELFIEHQIEHAIHNLIPHEVEIHVPHIDTLKPTAWATSALMLVIGGTTGWYFYWSRKVDSWAWVQASELRKTIHKFLWNRWYMNSAYYAVFVDGILSLSEKVYTGFEQRIMTPLSDFIADISTFLSDLIYDIVEVEGIFGVVNQGIPLTIVNLYHRVKKVQTGLLSLNLAYMALMFVILILTMLYLGGL
jgi:NADH-quinone oxidoreductase subunit L